MTKNLLLGSIAGNFLPVEDQQRCAKPPRFAQGTSGGLRLADELREMRGAPEGQVIYTLNPVIRGQANYYRTGASKKSFQALDSYPMPWALGV